MQPGWTCPQTALRTELNSAIKMVAAQAGELKLTFPRTTLQMRPWGELHPTPVSHICSDKPLKLTFNWESSEPEAARVYREFRGPIVNGYPESFWRAVMAKTLMTKDRSGEVHN